ncbi:MAG: sigma 54-interacting transcriptional regulator, partial [Proteobacteria bacterium]|nr:sigma 54-interacting transcriptional regulator [Pseudomonadota bacterium]
SDGLKYVLYRAEQVAPTNTTILILGETGSGKELIAFAIHDMSPRRERALITVNCEIGETDHVDPEGDADDATGLPVARERSGVGKHH